MSVPSRVFIFAEGVARRILEGPEEKVLTSVVKAALKSLPKDAIDVEDILSTAAVLFWEYDTRYTKEDFYRTKEFLRLNKEKWERVHFTKKEEKETERVHFTKKEEKETERVYNVELRITRETDVVTYANTDNKRIASVLQESVHSLLPFQDPTGISDVRYSVDIEDVKRFIKREGFIVVFSSESYTDKEHKMKVIFRERNTK